MINYEELLEIAKEACKNAYCPYSCFPVGAAVLYDNGNIYKGCNVENSSLGLALCAERNAISNAIAQGEKSKLRAIAIYSSKRTNCYPCGACRQWFCEFDTSEDFKIILQGDNKKPEAYTLDDLLPNRFKLV